ncbi:MAG: DUF1549 domain-containing protein, partial [Planctomycetota bacterium]
MRIRIRLSIGVLVTAACSLHVALADAALDSKEQVLSKAEIDLFERDVRPILVRRCYECHSAESSTVKGGLRVDYRDGLLRGGDNGPAVVPGQPAKSLLLQAVNYENPDLEMPPKQRLPAKEIAALERWIARGAPDPRVAKPKRSSGAEESFDIDERRASHWAWQPLRRDTPPEVQDASWPRETLDRYVLARLEARGLNPARETDRRSWLRRATFDVTGLPPTPAELRSFVQDKSLEAYERAVERLLASPLFGERWGVHWLDLVRYAETRGHEQDYQIPEAWRYRDYVVRGLNADVGYDDWVREHLAGDLLKTPRVDPV